MDVFTICSCNYLAHALTLRESVLYHHPESRFTIGLVDRPPAEGLPFPVEGIDIVLVESIGIPAFDAMKKRYNLVELNTAVKPFYFNFLYRTRRSQYVIYLDPDTRLYAPLHSVIDTLGEHSLVLTPHSCSHTSTSINIDYELAMLTTGPYNLGFLATCCTDETFAFLSWWEKRLTLYCYYRPGTGLFVDQLWALLAPVYFRGTYIERDPGYNVAYWNLHERALETSPDGYIVNGRPLVFYHFSNYSPERPEVMANRNWPKTFTFAERPEMVALFEEYRSALIRNGYNAVRSLRYQFSVEEPPATICPTFSKRLVRYMLRGLPRGVRSVLARMGKFVSRHCSEAL